jgi:O-antigen/teichoic acid export membrane protein
VVGRQTATGSILLILTRLSSRFIDLATMSILARNLSPTDFGLVAVAMTFVLLADAMLEMPVNEAMVRQPVITASQYDTAFTLGCLRGLVLSTIVVLVASPFASFYADPRLAGLLCVLSISSFSRGMRSPRLAAYHKQMSFWRDLVMEIGGKIAGFAVSTILCFWTHSYWSIAAASVVFPFAMAILSYILAPYRPRFSLSDFSAFSGFLGWMSLAQVISALSWQSDRLLMAKLTTKLEFGFFSAATDLANIPVVALFGPVMRPFLAAFSHVQNDPARLIRSYRTAVTVVAAIGLPVLVGESFLATPLVRLILGEQWLQAVPLLQWLALSLIPSLLSVAVGPLVMSMGKTEIFAKNNMIEIATKLPLLIVGAINFGFFGVIFARLGAGTVGAIYSLFMVRRFLGVRILEHLSWFWRSALSSVLMGLTLAAVQPRLSSSTETLNQLSNLLTATFLGGITYCAAMWALWTLSGRPTNSVEFQAAAEINRWFSKASRAVRKGA